jgi:hypothetical protein
MKSQRGARGVNPERPRETRKELDEARKSRQAWVTMLAYLVLQCPRQGWTPEGILREAIVEAERMRRNGQDDGMNRMRHTEEGKPW